MKELLISAQNEGITKLKDFHPSFYNYLIEEEFIIEDELDELQKVKDLSYKIDNTEENFVLTINPTMNCNFKCWYCYESHINDSKLGFNIIDSIKKLIDNLLKKEKLKHITLSFFGGEPLLYFYQSVIPLIDYLVEKCIEYKKSQNISFTTNGYLINRKFIKYFIQKGLFISLQITLDGYGEEHNKVRYVSKTKGSYNEIISNIHNLLEHDNFSVRARINYTADNINNCFKIIEDFSSLPNFKRKRLLFDFHRVWQDDQNDNISKTVDKNMSIIHQNGFKALSSYSVDNVKNSCYADKINSATINYNGDLFKCTARDFVTQNREGYLSKDGILIWENNSLERRMNAKFKNKPCLECKILPLCNGGCSQHAIEHIESGEEYCVYFGDIEEKNKIIYNKINEILDGN
ncbi:radical SAM/SPASM domain-containing protein [Flammeovirga kamogawensis]|uniref:Radical SAM protein n=1 Tax=Flammeovirga kamogawensis TaxID=373891 RepID=A0ABX8H5G8_9BACT|nr:radical SAM protein [Flammeovirga kamogawensis]MBB6463542.1 uncharacterized protein [Flammeovirga kamogawensis]QWG10597.1 radical SAM protein [Flammeovirga kamogawensis]